MILTGNTMWGIYNFRRGLIRALQRSGYRVAVVAPYDAAQRRLREEIGCDTIAIPMDNRGMSPARDLYLLLTLRRIYRELAPKVVLHYTIKPVIYGSLAAWSCGIPAISTITGLGAALSNRGWLSRLVKILYRLSQSRARAIVLLNQADRAFFIEEGLVAPERTYLIPGEGIDTTYFRTAPLPSPEHGVIFLYTGRLLWEKGVAELVAAARQLRKRGVRCRVRILGFTDSGDAAAVPQWWLQEQHRERLIEYLGATDNVIPYLHQAHCVVLPSYYREGVPRSLLEAAATGRPVITTDQPGCRDVVKDGVNGWLVRQRDASDLAEKMADFAALSDEERDAMGRAGRDRAEHQFSETAVVSRLLDLVGKAVRDAS